MTTYKITGADAIRLAERDQLTIRCYDNPIGDGVVSAGVAKQIVRDDSSLIYVTVQAVGWIGADGCSLSEMPGYNVSDFFSDSLGYLGADDDGIEPRWTDASEP